MIFSLNLIRTRRIHASGIAPGLFLALAFGLLGFMASMSSTQADDRQEPLDGVTILLARAEPAEAGGSSRLWLRIDNASGRTVILRAINSTDAGGSELILGRDATSQPAVAGLVLLDQEMLDLDSTHARARLTDLRRSLTPGDVLTLTLVFEKGAVQIEAHVVVPSSSDAAESTK